MKHHERYNRIAGYQQIANLSDADVAKALGITIRTYKAKIAGTADFSGRELITLKGILQKPIDELLATD